MKNMLRKRDGLGYYGTERATTIYPERFSTEGIKALGEFLGKSIESLDHETVAYVNVQPSQEEIDAAKRESERYGQKFMPFCYCKEVDKPYVEECDLGGRFDDLCRLMDKFEEFPVDKPVVLSAVIRIEERPTSYQSHRVELNGDNLTIEVRNGNCRGLSCTYCPEVESRVMQALRDLDPVYDDGGRKEKNSRLTVTITYTGERKIEAIQEFVRKRFRSKFLSVYFRA